MIFRPLFLGRCTKEPWMAGTKRKPKPLPTIGEVPDDLWNVRAT